jgi:tetratricopeptide (TPR) repeat protein
MRRHLMVAAVWGALQHGAFAAGDAPPPEPQPDPAPCMSAISANDDDAVLDECTVLIRHDKTPVSDRLKALIARAHVHERKDQADPAIEDYDAAIRLDAAQVALFNARGELWRKKGDRPRAIRDFGAALKLDPKHEVARGNYKSLAMEIERLGAAMAVKDSAIKGQPKAPLK